MSSRAGAAGTEEAPQPSASPGWRLGALPVALALAGLVLLGAACGSPSASPGVASIGKSTTTSTTTPAAGSSGGLPSSLQAAYQKQLEYTACMRKHGEPNFPEPVLSGRSISVQGPVDTKSTQFQKANDACKYLLPNGGNPPSAAQIAKLSARLLKYAQCMRAHGVPNFPDPSVKVSGNGVAVRIGGPGLDPSAPAFEKAQQDCRSLLPGGGPP